MASFTSTKLHFRSVEDRNRVCKDVYNLTRRFVDLIQVAFHQKQNDENES